MPKRILIMTDWAYPVVGGSEQHCFGLAAFLKRKGYEIEMLAPSFKKRGEEIEAEGVKIHKFGSPLLQGNGLLRTMLYVKNALRLHRKKNFDVFHGIYMANTLVAAVITAKITGKKSVITLFEPEPIEAYFKPVAKQSVLFALSKADYITTLNWTLEGMVKEWLNRKTRIETITNWISQAPKKSSAQEKPVVLFVGRLCEQKGCLVLIKAMPAILKAVPSARLVFVGPPWKEKEFRKISEGLGVRESIDFIGFVSKEELRKWYGKAAIVAYPSLYKGGFGFTVLEGMAAGKPIVGSDDVGIPDAIENAGVITKRGDEKSLAEGIIKLLTDKKAYAKYSENALKRAGEFTQEKIIKKYIDIYERIS